MVPVFPGPYTDAQKAHIVRNCVKYLNMSLNTPADEGFLEIMIENLEAGRYRYFEQAYDMLFEALDDKTENEDI